MIRILALMMILMPFVANAQDSIYDYRGLDKYPGFDGDASEFDSLFTAHFNKEGLSNPSYKSGHVKIEFVVDKEGNARELKIEKDSMGQAYANESLRVLTNILKDNKYKVGTIRDQPVEYYKKEIVRFFGCKEADSGFVVAINMSRVNFAVFPGGVRALDQFVLKNFTMPSAAVEVGASGKIYAQFDVDRNGRMKDIEILSDGVGWGCADEVLRVLNKAKNEYTWTPASLDGCEVSIRYRYPFIIKMDDGPLVSSSPDQEPIAIGGDSALLSAFLSTLDVKKLQKLSRGYYNDKVNVHVTVSDKGKAYVWYLSDNTLGNKFAKQLNKFLDNSGTLWIPGQENDRNVYTSYLWVITREDIREYLEQTNNQ